MKTIKLTGLIFCLSTLHSCFSNCNEIKLSNDDRGWSKCYRNAKKLIFSGDKNHRDIFVLDEKYEDYTTCSKFELGPDVYNYFVVSFWDKNDIEHNTVSLSLDKDTKHGVGVECIKSLRVYDLHATFDDSSNKDLVIEYISLPAISSKPIKTYRFVVGDQFSNRESNKVQSFNWSKHFGLVKYVMQFTNEEYFLHDIK